MSLLQGVESLLLVGGERWEDGGERIIYVGGGQGAEQAELLRHALRTNASARRAIRVVRAHVASAVELEEDESLAGAGRGGLLYRYDGLYLVQRAQAGIEDDDEEEPRFVLQRAPGQPPLSALAGSKRLHDEAEQEPSSLCMCGELTARDASAELPAAAEALLHGERLSVGQALEQLRGARDGLLAALQPGEAYLLARRSMLNQVRLRSAIELLHAADDTDEAAPCSRNARVSWQAPSPCAYG